MVREGVCNLREANETVVAEVWKKMNVRGVTNEKKEIVWIGLQECLTTRLLMKRRDLCESDVCSRGNCGGVEDCELCFGGVTLQEK